MATKIKTITVQNLKSLSSLSVDFNGCTAIVTGKNNAGKSSFLKSFPDRLRGLKPSLVLKQGEKEGYAFLELTTGEKFYWSFTEKGEKLTFVTERNIKSSVTKDISNYYFPKVFDVDKFLNSTPKEQRLILQKLTGIDFTEVDKKYQEAYDNRTYFNKQYEVQKAKAEFVDQTLPGEVVPTDDLEKDLASIELHNDRYLQVKKDVDTKVLQQYSNKAKIQRLRDEIAELEKLNETVGNDIQKGCQWMEDEKNILKDKDYVDSVTEKLRAAKELNKKIVANNQAKDQEAEIDRARYNATLANEEVKKLDQEKVDVIRNARMPEGFGFSEDGITYNGFEFSKEQLSSSGIYIAALKLAALNLGEVKTLHFDASNLDKNSLLEIEKWAEENNLQLLIERPDFDAGEIQYELLCPSETKETNGEASSDLNSILLEEK